MSGPVATRYSHAFVRQHLPENGSRLLEIGCGGGELAARLAADDFQVLAIDNDPDCIAAARKLGVDARLSTWPVELDDEFDAVLFTRSLHHINPLDEAVAAAVQALRPGGKIIVEDFRFELASGRTRAWFTGLMRIFDAAGMFTAPAGAAEMLEKLDFGDHVHELHSSIAIERALSVHGPVEQYDAAYYFRYAEEAVGEEIASHLLDYELSLIEAGAIDALGKRFVLTPPS